MQHIHKPFISASSKIPEFSLGPVLMGILLGVVFGNKRFMNVLHIVSIDKRSANDNELYLKDFDFSVAVSTALMSMARRPLSSSS